MSAPIEDYGLIGDCQTAALVGRDGSIDWLCWPRFDSDACFAALLGSADHGRWLIGPATAPRQVSRRYRPGTLVLETTFVTESGTATLIDFMLPHDGTSDLMRLVRCDAGTVEMRLELVLRFGYGHTVPWVTRLRDGGVRAIAGPDKVLLRCPVELRGEDFRTVATFSVREGETIPFELSHCLSHLDDPPPSDAIGAVDDCTGFWRDWIANVDTSGPYGDAICRSLITLKALTYAPSGGIVAAPTTSLPEHPGGERNWDYRFCWIRDATMTLLALMDAGVYDEAAAWRDWLQRAVAGAPADMQIMYGLLGERRLDEWQVDWLPGYLGSRPVRIGNAAYHQFQLDVYGELMDAFEQAREGGLATTEAGWALQLELVRHVGRCWREPDYGIWETRGPTRHFTYSKVMAWVTFDRAIKAVERSGLEGPVDEWRAERAAIHADVCEYGYDREGNTFRAAYGEGVLDASLLLLPQVGFVEPRDPRFLGTIEAIERTLLVDGFVRRYDTKLVPDGLQPGEGVFLACSCWLADAYAAVGRRDEALALFDRVLATRNDLGLLAEEYDTENRRLLGNFPQALSHISVINTAFNLTRAVHPSDQRAKVDHSEKRPPHAPRQPRRPGKPHG
ncbi:MAG: glycoside hydrolase family 15 protein [Enhydrobacter sp.]|nr:MAG: glycoside hydrolase family 15 protein [Enhydrobacter sp.]